MSENEPVDIAKVYYEAVLRKYQEGLAQGKAPPEFPTKVSRSPEFYVWREQMNQFFRNLRLQTGSDDPLVWIDMLKRQAEQEGRGPVANPNSIGQPIMVTFPITPDGLCFSVWIGLDGEAISQLIAAGGPLLPPMQARAVIDTGSNVTAIAPWLAARLGLRSRGQRKSLTAAGEAEVHIYRISLSIQDPADPSGFAVTLPTVDVSELTVDLPDHDVLIGMNVLLECKLLLDGPARQFTLEF